MPGSHAEHTAGDVGVAATSCTVPASQAPAGWHSDAFAADENVPSAHVRHCRSAAALPSALTWAPGAHVSQIVQLEAFGPALKLPLAHAVHFRSTVDDGAFET